MSPDAQLKVMIVGLNYAPEMVGIAVYTTGLAEALVARGHAVSVVAGKPYYPAWTVPPEFRSGWRLRSTEAGVDVTRVAHYVPSHPTGLRRILHHASFAASSLIPTLGAALRKRPDLVLTVAPSIIAAPVAALAARLVGAKSWLHIQDFEVEAAMATGLVRHAGLGARAARAFERAILALFHRVSSISPAMCAKLAEKGVAEPRIVEFRNWADIDQICPATSPSSYRAEWGIHTAHVALYSGNIANKQGIDIVVEAARLLRNREDLTFVVCGEGPNRAKLEAIAADLGNIQFHDLQPKARLKELLGLATVHLLPQLASAADLVLPSKLTNMLAAGGAVVAGAHPGTSLADEVEGCGLVVPPEDAQSFAAAIATLLDDEAARREFGRAARRRAETRWEREAIIGRLVDGIYALVLPDPTVSGAFSAARDG